MRRRCQNFGVFKSMIAKVLLYLPLLQEGATTLRRQVMLLLNRVTRFFENTVNLTKFYHNYNKFIAKLIFFYEKGAALVPPGKLYPVPSLLVLQVWNLRCKYKIKLKAEICHTTPPPPLSPRSDGCAQAYKTVSC